MISLIMMMILFDQVGISLGGIILGHYLVKEGDAAKVEAALLVSGKLASFARLQGKCFSQKNVSSLLWHLRGLQQLGGWLVEQAAEQVATGNQFRFQARKKTLLPLRHLTKLLVDSIASQKQQFEKSPLCDMEEVFSSTTIREFDTRWVSSTIQWQCQPFPDSQPPCLATAVGKNTMEQPGWLTNWPVLRFCSPKKSFMKFSWWSLPGSHLGSECTWRSFPTWRQHPFRKRCKVDFWERVQLSPLNLSAPAMWPSSPLSTVDTLVSWRVLSQQGVQLCIRGASRKHLKHPSVQPTQISWCPLPCIIKDDFF